MPHRTTHPPLSQEAQGLCSRLVPLALQLRDARLRFRKIGFNLLVPFHLRTALQRVLDHESSTCRNPQTTLRSFRMTVLALSSLAILPGRCALIWYIGIDAHVLLHPARGVFDDSNRICVGKIALVHVIPNGGWWSKMSPRRIKHP